MARVDLEYSTGIFFYPVTFYGKQRRREGKHVTQDDAQQVNPNDGDSGDELVFRGLSPVEIATAPPTTGESEHAPNLEEEEATMATGDHGPHPSELFQEEGIQTNPDPPLVTPVMQPTMVLSEDPVGGMDAIPSRPVRNRRPPAMLNYGSLGNSTDFQPYASSVQTSNGIVFVQPRIFWPPHQYWTTPVYHYRPSNDYYGTPYMTY